MRVLVTGASGFLGAHLCRVLAESGLAPVAGCRRGSDLWRLKGLAPDVPVAHLDLKDAASVAAALDEAAADAVVNCAGYGVNYNEQDYFEAYAINVAGAMNVARAALDRRIRIIQIGTSYEYGDWPSDISEDFPLKPKGVYGKTKAAASLALSALAESQGSDLAILRLFSMYGPLEGIHKLIPGVISATHTGRAMDMTPGEQIRDYMYVGDAAMAVVNALQRPSASAGKIFNIGSGQGIALRTLVSAAVGDAAEIGWGKRPYRPDEMMRVVSNPGLAAQALEWKARTPLAEGMRLVHAFEAKRPEGK